jgi:hypothetical protein
VLPSFLRPPPPPVQQQQQVEATAVSDSDSDSDSDSSSDSGSSPSSDDSEEEFLFGAVNQALVGGRLPSSDQVQLPPYPTQPRPTHNTAAAPTPAQVPEAVPQPLSADPFAALLRRAEATISSGAIPVNSAVTQAPPRTKEPKAKAAKAVAPTAVVPAVSAAAQKLIAPQYQSLLQDILPYASIPTGSASGDHSATATVSAPVESSSSSSSKKSKNNTSNTSTSSTSGSGDVDWADLLSRTQAHPRFAADYSKGLALQAETDAAAGYGWVRGKLPASNGQAAGKFGWFIEVKCGLVWSIIFSSLLLYSLIFSSLSQAGRGGARCWACTARPAPQSILLSARRAGKI